MPRNAEQTREKRAKLTPPAVSLRGVRNLLGLSLNDACKAITKQSPEIEITRGSLCAIENGSRGASAAMLTAIGTAYGIPQTELLTTYEPRQRKPAGARGVGRKSA